MDAENGFTLLRLSFHVRSVDDPEHDSLADVATGIRRLCQAYDRLGGQPVSLDPSLYEDDLSPA